MSYKCLPCNKGYDTPKGLSNHASSCQAKQMEEMRVVEFRKGQPSRGFRRKRAKTPEETFVRHVRRVEGPAKEDGALTDAGKIAGSSMSSISLGSHPGNLKSLWELPRNPNNKISGDNDFVQPNPDPRNADSPLEADEDIFDNNNALHTHLDVQPSPNHQIQPPKRRVPIPVRDVLPLPPPTPLDEDGVELVEVDDSEEFVRPESSQAQPQVRIVCLRVREQITTRPNEFGVYCKYIDRPTYEPDGLLTLEELAVGNGGDTNNGDISNSDGSELDSHLIHHPFPNLSQSLLSGYYYGSRSGERSVADFNELCRVISDARFQSLELQGFTAAKRDACIDRYSELEEGGIITGVGGGWQQNVDVPISIPEGRQNWTSTNGQTYNVPGFHHKSIMQIVRTWFENEVNFHYTPFELWWKSAPDASPMRLYGNISSSDTFKHAYLEVNHDPIFQMLLFWRNLAKQVYGEFMLSPETQILGSETAQILTWMNTGHIYLHFLMNCVILFASSQERHAAKSFSHIATYREGIVIKCVDGVTRRVYLRLFTYSADYPEKMLMLSLRNLGTCPCPRCLVSKKDLGKMGEIRDMQNWVRLKRKDDGPDEYNIKKVRDAIYGQQGKGITSTAIENILQPTSVTPTINTFSKVLPQSHFDKYSLFVVDLMHEVELGVWKAILTHLIRLLHALGDDKVQEFNRRFRQVPTFGRDTIRRFSDDVSTMTRLNAGNFEDILQCCLPVLESLFPSPHNKVVHSMVFALANWHALAKLQLHTDSTLESLSQTTKILGKTVRQFVKVTCASIVAQELPKEKAAHSRRYEKSKQKDPNSCERPLPPDKTKKFNISRPKFHFLGNYVPHIKWFGVAPGYCTQQSEKAHQKIKHRYPRVSKANPAMGLTKIDQREINIRHIGKLAGGRNKTMPSQAWSHCVPCDKDESLPPGNLSLRFQISTGRKFHFEIGQFLRENDGDPAVKGFFDKLREYLYSHLIPELDRVDDEIILTQDQRTSVSIQYNQIYTHQTCRINYTTYDMRRVQDSINPSTSHRDIMLHARDDPSSPGYHPYWYARVLGIFHCLVRIRGSGEWQDVHFLWVRWFERADPRVQGSINLRSLDCIGLVTSDDDTDAFGFVNPAHIIRACPLIPAFEHGETDTLLPGHSIGRSPTDPTLDFNHYYINRFVDRDMYMRYLGGGVGHTIHYAMPAAEELEPEIEEELFEFESGSESESESRDSDSLEDEDGADERDDEREGEGEGNEDEQPLE
ncbi:hypothetical protein M422DRAFT_256540 [Sphaerobolus stellatus SS14]|uniref:Unplaced genomic scaffold SPHSTscaffold_68, whole genome shotgun sequence n=1 Tax=Sphaerobolus stellatus (strain SS14) TaxID=990650 RepID=A0A0C9VGK7_SPHS4|nr:hypothetical protein M422DRAFT_256540 [Sphaerobolus stellatus SS14]